MTIYQREQLLEVLLEKVPDALRPALEAVATEDLDKMEPVLNRMLCQAFYAGMRFADRRTELQIVNSS